MKLTEVFSNSSLFETELKEGPVSNWMKAGALAAGVLGSGSMINHSPKVPQTPTSITQQASKPLNKSDSLSQSASPSNKLAIQKLTLPRVSHVSNNVESEQMLKKVAENSGIKGIELAAFLAQCNMESFDFENMQEQGNKTYFLQNYDVEYAPHTAELLGNVKKGDGYTYRGRGFLQLTGRYNYRVAGKALGLPLEENPDLASNPKIASKIAVWFWKNRVQPHVDDFSDIKTVTYKINPSLKNIPAREQRFEDYLRLI
jgi:putative chitinase